MRAEAGGRRVYAVEQYLPRAADDDVARLVSAVRDAACRGDALRAVRLVCSLFLPEDDLCLHLLAAASPGAAAAAADRAGIALERITPATAWFPG